MIMLTTIGYYAGENWEKWKDKLHYVDYAVALIILGAIAYLAVRWWRGRGDGQTPDAPDVEAVNSDVAEPTAD
jgi:membrane protein DedA with SNARE-associated domain